VYRRYGEGDKEVKSPEGKAKTGDEGMREKERN
jgi:hypothetical protein